MAGITGIAGNALLSCGMLMSANGCYSQITDVAKHAPYTLRYNAEPDNGAIYKDLIPVDLRDKHVQDVLRYARKTAVEAGYPLTGPDLDRYSMKGGTYPVEAKAWENTRYYMVSFNPGIDETSRNLEICVEKKTNRIITILQGS
jgi:hypothetical protein